jgi:hypothetical protein
VLAALLAWSTPALASYLIEAPPFSDKGEAASLNRDARATGHKGRVVRRFQEGEGWEYVVRWTFDEAVEAHQASAVLSKAIGAPLQVTDEDGTVVPAPAMDAPEADPEDAPAVDPGVDRLEDALDVHGPGLQLLADAAAMQVVFERTDAEGRIVRHTAARKGTDQYLRIEGVSGETVDSTTVATGERAWLVTAGKTTDQDLQRTRETLENFTLPAIAPIVLELDRIRKTHEELASLHPKGTVTLDGRTCTVFGTRDGSTLVAFDDKGVIRRASVDGGKRSYDFDAYEAIDDVLIPRTITTRVDGKVRDTVRITSIDLEAKVPDAWFVRPD